MKKMGKNNKGFSLVELIVVVLIMAIIAVALAPQIMKWVGHSRTATDAQTYDTLVENVQLALADENALKAVKTQTSDITIKMTESGVTISPTITDFENALEEICGDNWKNSVKKKDTAAVTSGGAAIEYEITVDHSTATVQRTVAPNTDAVK